MTASTDFYEDYAAESFNELGFGDEATLRAGPLKVNIPGLNIPGGLASATLVTPKGPAKLNLPAPVATLTQFRTLEQAVNANSQGLRAVNAEIVRLRQELMNRRRAQDGQASNGLLLTLLSQRNLRDDLEGHTHVSPDAGPAVVPPDGDGLASILPFLLLSQGGFGSGSPVQSGQDSMWPLLLILFATGR
jgi:hypothetical protein